MVTNQKNYDMMLNAHQVFTESVRGSHEWPLLGELRDLRKRDVFALYKDQLMHERATYTEEGRIKFEKPPNRKNDVSRAGIMALEAVRLFQKGRLGNPRDDPDSTKGFGLADSSIVDEADAARLAQEETEAAEQEQFDREEEEKYGQGVASSFLPDEEPSGSFALP